MSVAIYVHVPFCLKKCAYCDFLSFGGGGDYGTYFDGLWREIDERSGGFGGVDKYSVSSVFFGGGTPTVVPDGFLAETVERLGRAFSIEDGAEITTEANPETLDFDRLTALKAAGFNRLSVGAQSFDDGLLAALGRVHDSRRTVEAVRAARAAGFCNINLDLMFGLPGQSAGLWAETLDRAVGLGVEHVSCYSLTVEEGTPFYGNGVRPVDDDVEREMYYKARDFLRGRGFARYEISNFAKPGFECRHNMVYWKGRDYLGLGLGAHSFVGGVRFHNSEDIVKYLTNPAERCDEAVLTARERMGEFFFLGLRMDCGVSPQDFLGRFGVTIDEVYGDAVGAFVSQGLLESGGGRIRLTERGIDVSNMVFEKFLL